MFILSIYGRTPADDIKMFAENVNHTSNDTKQLYHTYIHTYICTIVSCSSIGKWRHYILVLVMDESWSLENERRVVAVHSLWSLILSSIDRKIELNERFKRYLSK